MTALQVIIRVGLLRSGCHSLQASQPVRSPFEIGLQRDRFAGLLHRTRATRRAGSVITADSGLYLPSESIGVRIDDDNLFTASDLKRLGLPPEKDNAA